jgi:hypothetical protein
MPTAREFRAKRAVTFGSSFLKNKTTSVEDRYKPSTNIQDPHFDLQSPKYVNQTHPKGIDDTPKHQRKQERLRRSQMIGCQSLERLYHMTMREEWRSRSLCPRLVELEKLLLRK